jgi:hypothetical protein
MPVKEIVIDDSILFENLSIESKKLPNFEFEESTSCPSTITYAEPFRV